VCLCAVCATTNGVCVPARAAAYMPWVRNARRTSTCAGLAAATATATVAVAAAQVLTSRETSPLASTVISVTTLRVRSAAAAAFPVSTIGTLDLKRHTQRERERERGVCVTAADIVTPPPSIHHLPTPAQAGHADNITPDTVELSGTLRALTDEHMMFMQRRIEEVAAGAVAAYGCNGTVDWQLDHHPYYPPTVNDADAADLARRVAGDVFGADNVRLTPAIAASPLRCFACPRQLFDCLHATPTSIPAVVGSHSAVLASAFHLLHLILPLCFIGT